MRNDVGSPAAGRCLAPLLLFVVGSLLPAWLGYVTLVSADIAVGVALLSPENSFFTVFFLYIVLLLDGVAVV
ncbi:MAG: hypothetical protein WBR18_09340 [Anaerolineales bacterium]